MEKGISYDTWQIRNLVYLEVSEIVRHRRSFFAVVHTFVVHKLVNLKCFIYLCKVILLKQTRYGKRSRTTSLSLVRTQLEFTSVKMQRSTVCSSAITTTRILHSCLRPTLRDRLLTILIRRNTLAQPSRRQKITTSPSATLRC